MTQTTPDSASNVEAILPLTAAQEGMLFHTLQGERNGAYFQQYSCELAAPLDLEAFRGAWQRVMDRHAALRTLFTWERRDKPLQVVQRHVRLPWCAEDWSAMSVLEQPRAWQQRLKQDRATAFRMDKAPLTRVLMVKLAQSTYRMLWSFHHIALDGWSMRLVLREVLEQYSGSTRLPATNEAPGFGHYLKWLDQQNIERAQEFWLGYLAGYDELCQPFFLRQQPRPDALEAVQTPQSQTLTNTIVGAQFDQLMGFSRQQRVTLNTLILGAWSRVLATAARTEDVVFGTTVAGRPPGLVGVEAMVGMFINTLPMRIAVDAQQGVAEWLQGIQANQVALRAFEYSPLTTIRRQSEVPAGESLFETIVVVENIPALDGGREDLLQLSNPQYTEYSNYPIALLVVPQAAQLELLLVYEPARVSAAQASALLAVFVDVLTALTTSATRKLGDVPLIAGESLRAPVVFEKPKPQALVVPRIAAMVDAYPHRAALVSEAGEVSYAQLQGVANAIALWLLNQGAGRGTPVVVLLERSPNAVAAILGTLQVGACYVPLDPTFPPDRIAQVLEDLQGPYELSAPVIISVAEHRHLVGTSRLPCLQVDQLEASSVTPAPAHPAARPAAADLAYIIYTSGSTGRAKGVMVSHANLAASTAARDVFYADAPNRYALLSSIATDSSVAGLFWTLTNGSTLLLPKHRAEQQIESLLGWLAEQRVTHLLCVPSLYRLLLESSNAGELSSLTTAIVAAEASDQELIRLHHELLPNAELVNEYGPTETTVWATAAHLEPAGGAHAPIPIGHPIAGTHVGLRDLLNQIVPKGWPGELMIGGLGVAQGYLGRSEETAKRFLPDPYVAGGVWYRTGDLAYELASGELVWLGRVDHQVKVRGYRIEPAEIDQVLLTHPGVREAATLLYDPLDAQIDELVAVLEEQSNGEELLDQIEQLAPEELQQALMQELKCRS